MQFELLSGKIERATMFSAAFDLFYNGSKSAYVGDKPIALETGVITRFNNRLVAIIKEKSGLGLKGLEIKGGVIDADYDKEWKVIVRNPVIYESYETDSLGICNYNRPLRERVQNWAPLEIKPGQKFAQFVLIELPVVDFIGAGIIVLDAIRTGGFGSTDLPGSTDSTNSPETDAYILGHDSGFSGIGQDKNPYRRGTEIYKQWNLGWLSNLS